LSLLVHHFGDFATGFRLTVALTLASFAGALAIGLVIASMRVSPVAPLRAAGTLYVETVRNIPLLVLMFLFFFGFPKIGIQYPPFPSAVITLSVYTGAFLAEAIRSGINTVAQGQAEAARAIGLTFGQSMRLVVLPQALRAVVAPIAVEAGLAIPAPLLFLLLLLWPPMLTNLEFGQWSPLLAVTIAAGHRA